MVKKARATAKKDMVNVTIGIFPGNTIEIEIENGSTVKDAIDVFQSEEGVVLQNYEMRINDELSTGLKDVLEEGDVIYFTTKKDGAC